MSAERCHVCGSEDIRPFIARDGFLRCRACGLVWLVRGRWPEDQERHYSEEYYPAGYAGRQNRRALFSYRFEHIKRYFRPQGELLEVGAA